MTKIATITERNGTQWACYTETRPAGYPEVPADRTVWVSKLAGESEAEPFTLGFYAASVEEASDRLIPRTAEGWAAFDARVAARLDAARAQVATNKAREARILAAFDAAVAARRDYQF